MSVIYIRAFQVSGSQNKHGHHRRITAWRIFVHIWVNINTHRATVTFLDIFVRQVFNQMKPAVKEKNTLQTKVIHLHMLLNLSITQLCIISLHLQVWLMHYDAHKFIHVHWKAD